MKLQQLYNSLLVLLLCGLCNPVFALTESSKLTASDGEAGDKFGSSVSIGGDRVIVGSPVDGAESGSAYVYERDGSGNWLQTKLTATDGASVDLFGISVSIDGDRAIVGSYLNDNDNGVDSGSAYVYERDGSGNWMETKLTASDGEADEFFG